MNWGDVTAAAIALSAFSLFVRWRWPTVHPAFASAGLGASAGAAILSFFHPPLILAISASLNLGLLAGLADLLMITGLKQAQGTVEPEGNGAILRLTFHGDDRHPTALKMENIATWFAYHSPSARIEGQADDGSRQKLVELPKSWAIFITYDRPTEVCQVVTSLNMPGLPPYNVLQSTKRACVISFSSDIPAGDLEIDVRAA